MDIEELFNNNAAIIVVFIFILMIFVWILSGISIPLLSDSPDTFESDSVTSITETDNQVIVTLEDLEKSERTVVSVDGVEKSWENSQVVVNKSDSDNIVIDAYVNDEIYDTYQYEINQAQLEIEKPDNLLTEQEYTFEVTGAVPPGDIQDIRWSIDDELVAANSHSINYEFEQNRTYNMELSATVGDITYTISEEINPANPDEVIVDLNVSETELEVFEEFEVNATETSNQNISEVMIDFDDGSELEESMNETVGHWYTEAGEYVIEATAENPDTGASGTDEVTVVVEEPEEEPESHRMTVTIFEDQAGTVEDASVTVMNTTRQTDEDGVVVFEVLSGNYDVTATSDGLEEVTENDVRVITDVTFNMRLSPEDDGSEEDDVNGDQDETEEGEEIGTESGDEDVEFEGDIDEDEVADSETPTGLDAILDGTSGDGSEEDPHIITNIQELQAMNSQPNDVYELGNDINAAPTTFWNEIESVDNEQIGTTDEQTFNLEKTPIVGQTEEITVNGEVIDSDEYILNQFTGSIDFEQPVSEISGIDEDQDVVASYEPSGYYEGFEPIDADEVQLDGQGHIIENLFINRVEENDVGLYQSPESGVVKNISLSAVDIQGSDSVGTISGSGDNMEITGVRIGGRISGDNNVGGFIGTGEAIRADDVSILTSINGQDNVGGLFGELRQTDISRSSIELASTDTPDGESITGDENVGGIVGQLRGSDVQNVYSTSTVSGNNQNIGGLFGEVDSESDIQLGYSATTVFSQEDADAGAIAGLNNGGIEGFYWDTDVAEVRTAVGNDIGDSETTGLSTENMIGQSAVDNMDALDYDVIWSDIRGTYPMLEASRFNEEIQSTVTINVVDSEGNEVVSTIEFGDETEEGSSVEFTDVSQGIYQIDIESDELGNIQREIMVDSDEIETTIEFDSELENPDEGYDINVLVTDGEDAIDGAEIDIEGEMQTQSDEGPVLFEDIGGDVTITADANGFEEVEDDSFIIEEERSEEDPIVIELEPEP